MGKYKNLENALNEEKSEHVEYFFAKIKKIIEKDLPESAYKRKNWWSNDTSQDNHPQCKAWLNAGYKVIDVDFENHSVTFVKMREDEDLNSPTINKEKKCKLNTKGKPFRLKGTYFFEPIKGKWIKGINEDKTKLPPKNDRNKFIRDTLRENVEIHFCTFDDLNMPKSEGVYLFVVDNIVKYIGRAANLKDRFSKQNYRKIYYKNCQKKGQSTNCKINWHIFKEHQNGKKIYVYFYKTSNSAYITVEKDLLKSIETDWNKQH